MKNSTWLWTILFCFVTLGTTAQDIVSTTNTEALLYLAKGDKQPLVVGLGGSEGGNAWASDYWKKTREQFTAKGYAFLALGYFGCQNTPPVLNQIALEDVYKAIQKAAKHPQINAEKIAVIGGSRGGDLALLLASYYPEIRCVVGLVASHAVFPGHTQEFTTSCWTYQGKELPFVPVNDEAIPFLLKRDLRGTFEAMLRDTVAVEKALIKVENIKAPVLLLSAKQDEICPSTPMAEKITARLQAHGFKYPFKHLPIEGSHTAPLQHFDEVFTFLEEYFMK
jgi:dipeptidyl aminopeptidase/acylaminoacyl peptidase